MPMPKLLPQSLEAADLLTEQVRHNVVTSLGQKTPHPTAFHIYGQYAPDAAPDRLVNITGYHTVGGVREKVPLCEDLKPGVLTVTEKCYSKCGKPTKEDCINRLLPKVEGKELEFIKHPACQSHFECGDDKLRRVLCEVKVKPEGGAEATGEEDPDVQAADVGAGLGVAAAGAASVWKRSGHRKHDFGAAEERRRLSAVNFL
eukprot:TRINITY_DN6897_c0_g1_i1.p2 TRINITY_DN6897_c0_g1~~TRINITY_DN6897_c0_g1_i1.p2  ORF type:complete len:202 (+),score=56.64 TRINITY_DN6897_c0_g1_i1:215-820(+)